MSIVHIAQSTANFRGVQGRVTYAEGFVPVRYSQMTPRFLAISPPLLARTAHR